jgi:S-adenosylmethionine hydrolase
MDNDINTSCVRISNGAQLSIPYKPMVFASGESDKQSHTVELQFKVSNIQKYGNLITNITRYKGDKTYYENFKKQEKDGYDNYDIYL